MYPAMLPKLGMAVGGLRARGCYGAHPYDGDGWDTSRPAHRKPEWSESTSKPHNVHGPTSFELSAAHHVGSGRKGPAGWPARIPCPIIRTQATAPGSGPVLESLFIGPMFESRL
jgi:hypothetical protein